MIQEETCTAFKEVIDIIETATVPSDPDAPSCFAWRLRPSEENAILIQRYLDPPPRWGIKLNLMSTFLGPEKCVFLSRKLILNNTVTSLDLSLCDMQEHGAVEFFSCLKRNKCLRHLNVDGNFIGDKGAVAASECVHNLETLHMSCNGITDIGALALASKVKNSSKIKTLNLRGNRITLYGAYKLADALEPISNELPSDIKELFLSNDVSTFIEHDDSQSVASTRYSAQGTLENSEDFSKDTLPQDASQAKQTAAPEVFNETLHTLWLQHNDNISEDFFKMLNVILAKRYPQPPKGIPKKKKKEMSKPKGK